MKRSLLIVCILMFSLLICGCLGSDSNPSSLTNQFHENNSTNVSDIIITNTTPSLHIQSINYQDSNGLNTNEKMDAISVALNSDVIKNDIQSYAPLEYVMIGNISAISSSEGIGYDSGLLNTSFKIAYVPISFNSMGINSMLDSYVVYVDATDHNMLGMDINRGKAGIIADVTIPPGAMWYQQLDEGSTGLYLSNNILPTNDITIMTPQVILNMTDTDVIYPTILSTDNFEKLKNGSQYNALEYVDYATNTSRIVDGSKPIAPLFLYNETAIWQANISINHDLPIDSKYFDFRYYYLVLENKNMNKAIHINFQ